MRASYSNGGIGSGSSKFKKSNNFMNGCGFHEEVDWKSTGTSGAS